MTRRCIGFQIASHLGQILHGEPDLEEFATFEVLTPAAAAEFLSARPNEGFMLMPIYAGDVENHVMISWVQPKQRAA